MSGQARCEVTDQWESAERLTDFENVLAVVCRNVCDGKGAALLSLFGATRQHCCETWRMGLGQHDLRAQDIEKRRSLWEGAEALPCKKQSHRLTSKSREIVFLFT